uniref:Uncharacterized protein n=1 Tax=Homo sapiens TaxID=9606 RepID=F1T0L9_HUMAN|nr:hypothetical protein HP10985 [Homo sapiens]
MSVSVSPAQRITNVMLVESPGGLVTTPVIGPTLGVSQLVALASSMSGVILTLLICEPL